MITATLSQETSFSAENQPSQKSFHKEIADTDREISSLVEPSFIIQCPKTGRRVKAKPADFFPAKQFT